MKFDPSPVKKIFIPELKVDYAPAFRFQHLWNGEPHSTDKTYYTILIALPITFNDSIHIINQVISCINDYSMKSLRFWVKPHPTMSEETLKKGLSGKWPEEFILIEGPSSDYISSSDIDDAVSVGSKSDYGVDFFNVEESIVGVVRFSVTIKYRINSKLRSINLVHFLFSIFCSEFQ